MEQSLLQQGIQLMLFGMGTVFVFLVVLIGCTTIMSRLVLRFAPADSLAADVSNTPRQDGAGKDPDRARLIAAISAAVHKHRTTRGE